MRAMKPLLILVIVVLLGLGGWWFYTADSRALEVHVRSLYDMAVAADIDGILPHLHAGFSADLQGMSISRNELQEPRAQVRAEGMLSDLTIELRSVTIERIEETFAEARAVVHVSSKDFPRTMPVGLRLEFARDDADAPWLLHFAETYDVTETMRAGNE